MSVELDWQAEEQNGGWEVIAAPRDPQRRKPRRRLWGLAILALVLVAAVVTVGRIALRHRYRQALARIAFQIQSTIDLEARALAQRDLALFMDQQDEAGPTWRTRQHLRFSSKTPSVNTLDPREGTRDGYLAIAVPQVQAVEVKGDVAWVEVVARHGPQPVRQVVFYRRTDLGWKHTVPQVAFWGNRIVRSNGNVIVRARQQDRPHIEPLVAHVSAVVDDVGRALGRSEAITLELAFSAQDPPGTLPLLSDRQLTVASPWSTGIPVDGTWEQAYLDELAYWAAYGTVLQALRPTEDVPHTGDLLLDRLWIEVIADEYAFFYSRGALDQTPLLKAIVDRHGVEALPDAIRSLRNASSASQFMARWLDPQESDAYSALLQAAREAFYARRGVARPPGDSRLSEHFIEQSD